MFRTLHVPPIHKDMSQMSRVTFVMARIKYKSCSHHISEDARGISRSCWEPKRKTCIKQDCRRSRPAVLHGFLPSNTIATSLRTVAAVGSIIQFRGTPSENTLQYYGHGYSWLDPSWWNLLSSSRSRSWELQRLEFQLAKLNWITLFRTSWTQSKPS
jgi:hypothetical protein